ncbi:MAG: hypothetical protein N2316_08445 [Spirochaetes bacterium]|nr:hypothetical protein [Spirochaetota bacterium]
MSRTITVSICIMCAILMGSCLLFAQQAQQKGSVLVLGFSSHIVNDAQDMLLRNYIMREFLKKGYGIVPIMAIEGYAQEKSFDVRQATRGDMKRLSAFFHADYAISGSIELRRKKLFVSVSLFQKDSEQFYSFIIPMGKMSEFQEYCPALAREIVIKAEMLIQNKK